MLKVLYFAALREAFERDQEMIELPAPATVAGLVDALRERGGVWADALGAQKHWRVAVNQEMAALDASLCVGDEVAIFPPVTGG